MPRNEGLCLHRDLGARAAQPETAVTRRCGCGRPMVLATCFTKLNRVVMRYSASLIVVTIEAAVPALDGPQKRI